MCQFGHFVEGELEINDDEDTFTVTTKRITGLRVSEGGKFTQSQRPDAVVKEEIEVLSGQEHYDLYMRCLQILVRRYGELFIEEFGLQSQLEVIMLAVKQLWIKVASFTAKFYLEGKERDPDFKVGVYKVPDVYDIIVMIYLSIVVIGAGPVYIDDVVLGIRSNRIPSVSVFHRPWLPKQMYLQLRVSWRFYLQPNQIPQPNVIADRFRMMGNRMFGSLKLPVGSLYYLPFVYRLVDQFNLPLLVIEIYHALNPHPKWQLVFGKRAWGDKFPELTQAGMIVLIAKYFTKEERFDREQWLAFYQAYQDEFHPLDIEDHHTQLTKWSSQKTRGYCEWIMHELIDPQLKSGGVSSRNKRLFSLFDPTYNFPTSEVTSPRIKVLASSEIDSALVGWAASKLGVSIELMYKMVHRADSELKKVIKLLEEN